MRTVFEAIVAHGDRIEPSKGAATELTGMLLELRNPRARLSRSETRGMSYSCLGELCWYLAGRKDLAFIEYYLPLYEKFADAGEIFGAYGPRLINWRETAQLSNVTSLLKRKKSSRRAVIQLFDALDLVEEDKHADIPCTCTLQFMVRKDRLHMLTCMRSNDAFRGLPHDIFCFTMLQEIVARELGVDIGEYKHAVGSLHLYEENMDAVKRFLDEGWQPTGSPMPAMPLGDPWKSISVLLRSEHAIRESGELNFDSKDLNPYWADLIRLLQVLRCKKDNNPEQIKLLRDQMDSNVYSVFIEKMLNQST